MELKIGDIVILHSGGMFMTVLRPCSEKEVKVDCVWHDEHGHRQFAVFHKDMLAVYDGGRYRIRPRDSHIIDYIG